MTITKSISVLFALSLSASAIAEEAPIPEKSYFNILSDKEFTLSVGKQLNTLEAPGKADDFEFNGSYFSASFKPIEKLKISASYFTSETDTLSKNSLQDILGEFYSYDNFAIQALDPFGLDYHANGWGETYNENGDVDRYFNNSYFISNSIEMNEFEVGASYTVNFSNSLSYDFYLGYVSGQLTTNENLSNKLIFNDDLSQLSDTLVHHINNNEFNNTGFNDNGEEFKQQNYADNYGYLYRVYPSDNLNAHNRSTTVDYSIVVLKIEADFAVTEDLHLIAGLSSESTTMDNVDENLHDTVFNVGASYAIWNGIGVELNHKIYDGQTKTSFGVNYKF